MTMPKFSTFLVAGFLTVASFSQAEAQKTAETLTPAQKNEVQNILQEYLRTNPEIILEAIEVLRNRERQGQQNQAQQNLASSRTQLLNDPTSPIAGNPNGDVTMVEFFDYSCHFCKRVFPSIQSLLKQDKNLRYVFKEFPILSPESQIAARAALVVWKHEKDKYFAFHTELMKSHGGLSERRIFRMAEKVGANVDIIKKEMNSTEISEILRRNFDLAQQLGVRGAPGFVIGDRIIPGAVDLATIKRLIAEERNKG